MRALTTNERGIFLMIAATASFSTNDTLLKLATQSLPPFETIFIRSIFASLWAVPLLAMTGGFGQIRHIAQPRVIFRNIFELLAGLGFVVGLANVPIAEFTALVQMSPILLMLGAALFLHIRVTRVQITFALVAFVGALLVAQPGAAEFSLYALLGLWAAAGTAARELVGRTVPAGIPGMVVALGAALVMCAGAGVAMLFFESFRMPDLSETGLIFFAALFITGGQVFIFLAYRTADPGTVAPFFYSATLWATIASGFVFGVLPNGLAFAGMTLVVASGLGVLIITEKQRSRKRTGG